MKSPFRSKFQVTQEFGARPEYYSKFGLKGHEGIDLIPIDSNYDILCLEEGVVVKDEDNPMSGVYGRYITIWHQNAKLATQYCHLANNLLSLNQNVKKGQLIGKMGSSGNTQGAHLHLNLFQVDNNGIRLNKNNGYNGGIDPLPFLEESSDTHDEIIKNLNQLINDKNNQISNLQGQISTLESNTASLEMQKGIAEDQAKKVPDLVKNLDQCESDRKSYLEEREHFLRQIGQLKRFMGELKINAPKAFFHYILDKFREIFHK